MQASEHSSAGDITRPLRPTGSITRALLGEASPQQGPFRHYQYLALNTSLPNGSIPAVPA